MHHEDGKSGMGNNMTRNAANQALAQAAPSIASNHKQIGVSFRRRSKQNFPDALGAWVDNPLGAAHAMQRQILFQSFGCSFASSERSSK